MNPFIYACIAPHGGEVIPELAGKKPKRMLVTRESMYKMGKNMEHQNPDVIVLLTPHGTRINGQFSISGSERILGTVEENENQVSMERMVDRELAEKIGFEATKENSPTGIINYGTNSGPISCLPLDWGAIVPLWFMPNVPVVIITPPRDLPLEEYLRFGKILRNVVTNYPKRVALLASCDWSHTHDKDGPYGYHPAATKLDQTIVSLIKDNYLEDLSFITPKEIDDAKPDGIWQTLIVAGAIEREERQIKFLSYEVPTYFGLICAELLPTNK